MPQNKFSGSVDEILENLKKEESCRPASDRAVESILADLGLESAVPKVNTTVQADVAAIMNEVLPSKAEAEPRKAARPVSRAGARAAQPAIHAQARAAQPAPAKAEKPEIAKAEAPAPEKPKKAAKPAKAPTYPIRPQRLAPPEEEPTFAPPKLGATMQLDSDFQKFFSESVAVIPDEETEQHPGFFARFLPKRRPADADYFEEEDYLDNPDPTNLVEEGTLMIPGQKASAGGIDTQELEIPLQPERAEPSHQKRLGETQEIFARINPFDEPESAETVLHYQDVLKQEQPKADLDATREIRLQEKKKPVQAVTDEPTQVLNLKGASSDAAQAQLPASEPTGTISLVQEPTGTIDLTGQPTAQFTPVQGEVLSSREQAAAQFDMQQEPEEEKKNLLSRFHLPNLFGSEEDSLEEPFDEIEPAGYMDDFENQEDAPQVEAELGKMRAGFGLRAAISGVVGLLMLYMGISAASSNLPAIPVLDPAISPTAYLAVQMILLLGVAAINWRVFAKGVLGIWQEPTQDSIPAVAAIGAAIQLLFALMDAENYVPEAVTLFAGPAVILLCVNALGRWLMAGATLRNFQMVCAGTEHTVASIVKDRELVSRLAKDMGEPEPCLLANRPAGLVKGFLKSSFSLRASDAAAQKACWILLGGAGISAIVCAFTAKSAELSLAAFAGSLCLGAPLAATLISAVPSVLMQKSAARVGAVIPGWSAIAQLGRANMVTVGAKDLFPSACVRLHGIKTFEKQRIDLAILYAASVLIKGCDTLRDVFMEIVQDRTDILYQVENLENDPGYGFTAWVDNNRVIVGNRAMMEKQGVEIPSLDYEKRYTKGRREPVYLAVSGRIYAMFIVSYRANAQVAATLESLRAQGVSVLVSSDDFCLNSRLAAQVYGLPTDCIKVLSQAERRLMDPLETYEEKTEGCMIHLGSFASFVGGLIAAAGAAGGEKNASFVQNAGVIFSCVLALLLSFTGGIAQLSIVAVLLYGVAWAALALAMPMLRSY